MNNIELFKDENSNKLVQKLDNLTINLGEDNQDVLNIDSSVYVNNIERHIPDEFKTTDKNKYLIVDTNNNYKYVDLNLDNSKFRFHKICSEKGDYDASSGVVTPTDGDIHLKMNETMIIFLNFSAYINTIGVVTWTFKYRIKGTGTYLAFDYPELGQFKHYYNATADHQHRSGQIVFSSSSQDIIIDSFDVDFTNGIIDHNDFVSMNALIIPNNYLKSQDWVNYVLNDYKSNNAGSELITNGDSEIWNKPTTNNLIGIDNDSAYNAVTVNKDNTALTCMSNNEVIQLPAGTTSQRPNITKNGQIRYNTTTSCYEIYKQNSWKKIITSDISINTQVNMEVTDSSYYNQMPAPYSASICLLHRDFVGDPRYQDGSPFTSYGAYVNIQQKEYAPDYSEYFGRNVWHENSFDTIIYDSSPEHNMAYVRKFEPGENPRDTVSDSDTWNGGGIVIRKSGIYIMYYSSSIRHYGTIDEEFYTAFYKNDTLISQQAGRTTKTINGIGHNFIDKNYTAYLQEGDLIRIRSYHTRNSHTTWSKDNMISYDYNDPTNSYNYDYMLNIASKLTVRLLDSSSLDSGGGSGGY